MKKNLVNSDPRCPTINLYATECTNLFLTPDLKAEFKKVRNADFVKLLDSKLECAFKQSTTSSKEHCNVKMNIHQKKEIHLGNGTYITRKGDLLYVNTCMEPTAKIMPYCHTGITIKVEEYVNTQTKRKIDSSNSQNMVFAGS